MAGEINRIRTSDGVDHLIDYASLANKPDVDAIEVSVSELRREVDAILAALARAGIEVGGSGASVSGRTLSLSGATVSGRTLSVTGASVSGRTLSFGSSGGTDASVSDGTMTLSGASVSGRTLSVPGGSVSGSELQF